LPARPQSNPGEDQPFTRGHRAIPSQDTTRNQERKGEGCPSAQGPPEEAAPVYVCGLGVYFHLYLPSSSGASADGTDPTEKQRSQAGALLPKLLVFLRMGLPPLSFWLGPTL